MKKQITLFFAAIWITTFQGLYAQKNLLQLTPAPVTGKFSAQYQRKISNHFTLVAEWQLWRTHRSNNPYSLRPVFSSKVENSAKVKGNRFQMGGRYYTQEAFQGWFCEGGLHWGSFDIFQNESHESLFGSILGTGYYAGGSNVNTRLNDIDVFGAKLGGGLQKRKGSFSLDVSFGMELNISRSKNPSKLTSLLDFARPYARMAVGYVF